MFISILCNSDWCPCWKCSSTAVFANVVRHVHCGIQILWSPMTAIVMPHIKRRDGKLWRSNCWTREIPLTEAEKLGQLIDSLSQSLTRLEQLLKNKRKGKNTRVEDWSRAYWTIDAIAEIVQGPQIKKVPIC